MQRSREPGYEARRLKAQRQQLSHSLADKLSTPVLKRLLKSGILNNYGRRQAYGELVKRRNARG